VAEESGGGKPTGRSRDGGRREREREREKRREVETGGPKRAKSAARRVRGRNYRGLSVAYGAQRTLMESS